jgi:hypothetical protein
MSDQSFLTPPFIGTLSRWSLAHEARLAQAGVTVASGNWSSANQGLYVPFWLPWPYPVQRLWWVNGSAAGGNWDIGLYTINLSQIYASGSTAGSGNSVPQFVTPSAPLLLAPGRYFFGISHSATTANQATGSTSASATRLRMLGVTQEASALPLPATATPVARTGTMLPLCGITRTASGG